MKEQEMNNKVAAQDYTDAEILEMLGHIFSCGTAKHGSKVA
jgi:hypothetical protein